MVETEESKQKIVKTWLRSCSDNLLFARNPLLIVRCARTFSQVCVLLAKITGNAVWDGVGTLSIGVLLGVIAIVLAIETKSLLIGEGALPEQSAAITSAITGSPEVLHLIDLRSEYLGPETLLVAAKIEFRSDMSISVSEAVNAVEARIRDVEPLAKIIYLEPASKVDADAEVIE